MTRSRVPGIVAITFLLACATPSERDLSRAYQHRQLAETKLAKGELEVAIREYQTSLELFARDPECHFGIAEAYRRKGLLPLAEEHLLEAVQLRRDHHEARLNLGVVYMLQERWVDGIAVFQALVDEPTFIRPARALVNLGWAQYKSGDHGGARTTLARAISLERRNHTAHLDMGIVLYEQGDVVEAIRHFEEVLQILENRPVELFGVTEAEARFRAAQAFVKLGKQSEAIVHLELAARRGGASEWGQRSRDYLAILK